MKKLLCGVFMVIGGLAFQIAVKLDPKTASEILPRVKK